MAEYSLSELSAFTSLLGNTTEHLAAAMTEALMHPVTLEPPSVSLEEVEDVVAGATTVLQTAFSFPPISPDEAVLAFSGGEAHLLASIAEGGDGSNAQLPITDEQLNVLADTLGAIVQGLATGLGAVLGTEIEGGPCTTTMAPLNLPPAFAAAEHVVVAQVPFHVEDILDSRLVFYFTTDFARAAAPVEAQAEARPTIAENPSGFGVLDEGHASGAQPNLFDALGPPTDALPRGIDLILDIPLDVTVELGRVRMLIKDVLALSTGSIVELQRVAGEPVDLLVNGRLVAKGEVVVIDDNFGIRITEIIGQADRVAALGKR
jgi:flagellar motor switch protein FliN/FliY